MLDNYLKWFKAHEFLAIALIIVVPVALLGNKALNKDYDAAVAREKSAEQTLQTQKEQNDKLAIQNQQAQQQYQVLLGQVSADNKKLTAEMLQLSQTLAARQKQDAALPLPELASRWEFLIGTSGISSTENGLQASPDAARATVSNLESLPVLKQQLADETTLAGDKDKQITSLGQVVGGQNTEIAGLNIQLSDASKACQAQVAVARKSKWRWFKFGFVTGFVTGVATGHYL
jgi:hypothetical protein